MVSFRGGTTSSDDTDYRCSCSSFFASNLHGDGSYLRPDTVHTSSTNAGAASSSDGSVTYHARSAGHGAYYDGTDATSSIDASSSFDAAGSINYAACDRPATT